MEELFVPLLYASTSIQNSTQTYETVQNGNCEVVQPL